MTLLTQMIWIDYAITGLIGIFLVTGLIRGVHKEALSLFSWLLAVGAGWCLAFEFSGYLQSAISHLPTRLAATFACLLIITRILTAFVFFLLYKGASTSKMSMIDHFSGMLIGAVRGAVIVAAIILLSGLTPLSKDSWWAESKLIPPFQSSALWIRDHVPSGMAGYIRFS
ncbi:MAG: CvpA family protein [Gammaproteobacteria bacterium]